MSYRNYQHKQNNEQSNDLLDNLYTRLAERDTSSDLDLTQSIKSMSKRWLQEAYIDGMMLADKLNRVTSSAKQNLDNFKSKKDEFEYSQPQNSVPSSDQMAQMVQLEVQNQLQRLGFSKPQEQVAAKPSNGFLSFAFGMILLLSGFFLIGGAAGYYGLDSKVASFASQTYSSLTSEPKSANSPVDQNNLAQNQATAFSAKSSLNRAAIPELGSSQNLINQTPAPESEAPALTLPSSAVAANTQNLTADTAPSLKSNPAQNGVKVLPASCDGQEPILNRPLDIQNPSDRAILYCILDLQAQNQGFDTGSQTPNSNQIPQR